MGEYPNISWWNIQPLLYVGVEGSFGSQFLGIKNNVLEAGSGPDLAVWCSCWQTRTEQTHQRRECVATIVGLTPRETCL